VDESLEKDDKPNLFAKGAKVMPTIGEALAAFDIQVQGKKIQSVR